MFVQIRFTSSPLNSEWPNDFLDFHALLVLTKLVSLCNISEILQKYFAEWWWNKMLPISFFRTWRVNQKDEQWIRWGLNSSRTRHTTRRFCYSNLESAGQDRISMAFFISKATPRFLTVIPLLSDSVNVYPLNHRVFRFLRKFNRSAFRSNFSWTWIAYWLKCYTEFQHHFVYFKLFERARQGKTYNKGVPSVHDLVVNKTWWFRFFSLYVPFYMFLRWRWAFQEH